MRKIYTLISIAVFLFAVSCKTASKLYDKGNYDEAVELAVKKLQKKPDDEMRALLQSAYQYAVNDHEHRILQLSNSKNDLKWEWIYAEYSSLQRLHDAIHRSPGALSVVRPTDYLTYLDTYANKAADARFERGTMLMDKNDRLSFRAAYKEFEIALQYRPEDLTIRDRKDEAYENAVINVVLLPTEKNRFRFSAYNDREITNIENDLLHQLQYNTGNQFVRFLRSSEATIRNIQADQFIDLRFSSFDLGRTRDEKTTRQVSKDIVIKETVYRPDSVVKEYKKVYAKITTTKRTLLSYGSLQISARDAGGSRIWSEYIRGDHNWYTEFSTFTGDERALTESDKQLVNVARDNPPNENEITRCIINEINTDMSGRLRNYFSRL
ncbi:MAG TPA: hypothetical protein VF144_14925 [Chitinophagaceae bacterium]